MKLLIQSDSPIAGTGFARITREIAQAFYNVGWTVDIIGVNHKYEDMVYNVTPYRIFGMLRETGDPQGKHIFSQLIHEHYDLFIIINDIDIVNDFIKTMVNSGVMTKTLAYIPVDTDYYTKDALSFLDIVDKCVVFTKSGADIIKKLAPEFADKVSWQWLGVDSQVFKPLKNRSIIKKNKFGTDSVLITNVNRHTPRKDLMATVKAISLLNKKMDCIGYLHCKTRDVAGDIVQQIAGLFSHPVFNRSCGAAKIIVDESLNFKNNRGISDKSLNDIYNASDYIVSTSYGEGFGLSTLEAMAAGRPIVVPRNTANIELIGENEERGWFIQSEVSVDDLESGSTTNHARIRTRASDLAHTLFFISKQPKANVESKIKQARQFAMDLTWQKVGQYFLNLYNENS